MSVCRASSLVGFCSARWLKLGLRSPTGFLPSPRSDPGAPGASEGSSSCEKGFPRREPSCSQPHSGPFGPQGPFWSKALLGMLLAFRRIAMALASYFNFSRHALRDGHPPQERGAREEGGSDKGKEVSTKSHCCVAPSKTPSVSLDFSRVLIA